MDMIMMKSLFYNEKPTLSGGPAKFTGKLPPSPGYRIRL
jgi:hypothetical protein